MMRRHVSAGPAGERSVPRVQQVGGAGVPPVQRVAHISGRVDRRACRCEARFDVWFALESIFYINLSRESVFYDELMLFD